MGLLDDYLSESEAAAKPSVGAKKEGSSIINMYLNSSDDNKTRSEDSSAPRPFTAEEAAAAKARPATNPRDSQLLEGIKAYPGNVASRTLENVQNAGALTAQGAGEVLS